MLLSTKERIDLNFEIFDRSILIFILISSRFFRDRPFRTSAIWRGGGVDPLKKYTPHGHHERLVRMAKPQIFFLQNRRYTV